MGGTAFVLGGTGMIGRAVVPRLLAAGWDVTIGSRGERPLAAELEGARHVRVDRTEAGSLEGALDNGADVLIDVLTMRPTDGVQLLSLAGRVGSLVAISTASVYTDAAGTVLDDGDFPDYPVPILESQPTVAGEAATYSRDKAGLERLLLGQDRVPATVIRPCAIHGPGDRQAREWHFVKRALDRRPFVPIAYGGDSVFHTTSAENLGELIRVVCEQPGTRALNCGDPEPPSVLEISRVLARVLEHERAEVLLPGPPVDGVGATPWSAPKTLRVDMAAAHELGYAPVVHYEEAVARTVDYLVSAARDRGWEDAFPVGARYIRFDYEAEDAFVRSLLRA